MAGELPRDHITSSNAQQFVSQQRCAARGQVVSASVYVSTRWQTRARAAQCLDAQRAGVVIAGASATLWEQEVQAQSLGGWQRTGSADD